MSQKISTRQSRQNAVLPMVGNSVNEQLDSLLLKVDAQLSKLFEDRNVQLSGGGLIVNNAAGDSVTFSSALALTVNSKVAGGSPISIDLTSTTRAFTADGNMLYALIDRVAGTATITANSSTLPAVTAANQEIYLIAKRVGNAVYFRNGRAVAAGKTLVFDRMPFYQPDVVNEAAATGASALLPAYSAGVIRLTSATITSLGGMTARQSGVFVVLTNSSGADITVNNDDSAVAAANRFLTGTDNNITLRPNSSFIFIYDETAQRWMLAGGSGSGSGSGSGTLDTLFVQTFEEAALGDFTQTGLIIDTTTADLINGTKTAKLIHDSVAVRDFKEVITLPKKYQSFTGAIRNLSISLYARSNATAGNVTLEIRDETNNVLISSEVITAISTNNANENLFSFDVPLTCESISYKVSALAQSGSPQTFVDDISIFLTPSELVQTLLFQENDTTIELGVGNGFGSTGTVIRRFSSIRQQLGSGVSYTDSATLGASFTILEDGIYDIAYTETSTSGTPVTFITKNQAVLTAQPANIEILAATTISTPTGSQTCSVSLYLIAGDVIRAVCNSVGLINSTSANARFSITKQGQLKQVNTNPDSKITIPTSELRMEGASTRGATATAIVRFDAVAKLKGDAFTVESDATLGTRITMRKAGKLDIAANVLQGATSTVLTINQTNLTLSTTNPGNEILARSGVAANNAANAQWSGSVKVGDVIRVAGEGVPTAYAGNSLNMFFQEQDISVSVTNIQPKFSDTDSSVRVDTANGYGSTATKIRRFNNIRQNIGSDIAYADSVINGASFTILEDGVFNISYSEQSNSTNTGISLNADSFLTTNIVLLGQDPTNTSLVLAMSGSTTTNTVNCSWQGFLPKGSIIRPHTDGAAATDNENARFTISKVGKPNVTSVDVTPFVVIPQTTTQAIEAFTSTTTFGSTNTGTPVLTITKDNTNGIISVASSATLGTTFTVLKRANINIIGYFRSNAANTGAFQITRNSTILTATNTDGILATVSTQTANVPLAIGVNTEFFPGDVIRFHRNSTSVNQVDFVSITAEALSDQIITEIESFSSDTAPFAYAGSATYTLSTLQNAPVGTFITFTYAANTSTRTQTNAAPPTQTVADMNANGVQVFPRAFNAASTSANPSTIAIQIGKGLKGKSLELFKSAGKLINGSLDCSIADSTSERGMALKEYDEKTGILYLDAGILQSGTSNTHNFLFSDLTVQASGYVVINASKNPALAGINVLSNSTVFNGYLGANQALTANVTNISPTVVESSVGINYAGGIITITEAGNFEFALSLLTSAGVGSIDVYVNGAQKRRFMGANNSAWTSGSILLPSLRPNDQISFRSDTSITLVGAANGIVASSMSAKRIK